MDRRSSVSDAGGLAPELVDNLYALNPWWRSAPMLPQPRMRRHLADQIRRRLETEIAPIVAVRGPRQVGKTTAQLQIIADLLGEGVPPTSILRVGERGRRRDAQLLKQLCIPPLRRADADGCIAGRRSPPVPQR